MGSNRTGGMRYTGDMTKEAGQTMRIDLASRDLARAPAPRTMRRRPAASGATTFSARRRDRMDRNTPYDLLLESVYDGVLVTDRKGRIIDFNGRAAEFFQAGEEQLLGMPVWNLFSGADDTLVETIQANLQSHKYALIEALCLRADGTSFPTEIAVNRIDLDEEGHQLCFFVRDTTVRKRAQEELENAVERLQAHDRARMEFVSNVSHELRTPLTSMIYAVNNMLRGVVGPLPEKVVRYLERFDSDCKRLLTTVNDILDLRQMESQTLSLAKSRVACAALIHTGVETLRVQADAKKIRILVELPPYDLFSVCDVQKMERVMINVLGNAVKFTPDEGGTITVRLERDLEQDNLALITVGDSGVGIPPEALQRITQRYFRVGSHVTGSGLGLSISREIIELHGGSLRVASPVPGSDGGTAVSIRLPLGEPPAVAVFSAAAEVAAEAARQVVRHGYRAREAHTAEEALQLCTVHETDMLVFECACGTNPDFELLLKVRNDARTRQLPALVVSRSEVAKPCQEMLHHLGIPVLPIPWKESDLAERLSAAFSGRSRINPV